MAAGGGLPMESRGERDALDLLMDSLLSALDDGADDSRCAVHAALLRLSHSDACAWNVLHIGDRMASVATYPNSRLDPAMAVMTARRARDHPLLWHHVITGDVAVRSPDELDPDWRSGWVFDFLRSTMGITEQVAVPVRFTAHVRASFALGRDGRPYDTAEREALSRAQRLLRIGSSALELRARVRREIDALLPESTELSSPLSPREREVLTALASGRSRRIVARELGISPRTMDKHVEHINAKLGTASLLEALSATTRSRVAALP